MTDFPTYQEARRWAGGIIKFCYDKLSDINDRMDDVEAGVVAEGSIGTDELADEAVTTDKIDDAAVDTSKLNIFASTEQTGDGTEQDIAHGLGVVPSTVLVIPSLNKDGADCSFAQGTHGTANVKVTATTGAKYYVIAIA